MVAPSGFEWDEAKEASNVAKHSLTFGYATRVFLDPQRVDDDATRAGQGEVRRKAVGLIEGRLITVVYTMRGPAYRIISARRSNAKEGRTYGYHSEDT